MAELAKAKVAYTKAQDELMLIHDKVKKMQMIVNDLTAQLNQLKIKERQAENKFNAANRMLDEAVHTSIPKLAIEDKEMFNGEMQYVSLPDGVRCDNCDTKYFRTTRAMDWRRCIRCADSYHCTKCFYNQNNFMCKACSIQPPASLPFEDRGIIDVELHSDA